MIPNLPNDHLIKPLQAALLEDGEHAVVSEFELVAIRLRELQLGLLLLVQALVALVESGSALCLRLLRFLSCCMVAYGEREQELGKVFVLGMRGLEHLHGG